MSCGVAQKDETGDCQIIFWGCYYYDDDDDDDGATVPVMSTGLAAIGITFTGITIAAIARAQESALGPTNVRGRPAAPTHHPPRTIGTTPSDKAAEQPAARLPRAREAVGEGQAGATQYAASKRNHAQRPEPSRAASAVLKIDATPAQSTAQRAPLILPEDHEDARRPPHSIPGGPSVTASPA